MADHRAEQIMAAVTTAVTGLATTGANVQRGRVYPWGNDQAHAISVYQGDAEAGLEQNFAQKTVALTVNIVAHVKTVADQVDTHLNQVAKEAYIAIMADRTLALPFVIDTDWRGSSAPDTDGNAEATHGRQEHQFIVIYRHSSADPSQ
jgi:hypothetical protein